MVELRPDNHLDRRKGGKVAIEAFICYNPLERDDRRMAKFWLWLEIVPNRHIRCAVLQLGLGDSKLYPDSLQLPRVDDRNRHDRLFLGYSYMNLDGLISMNEE